MRIQIKFLVLLAFVALFPTPARGEDQMCKVHNPNDTDVHLRYPANKVFMRALPNGSWIWVDPYRTEYDQKNRPWTAVINQRSKSQTGREFVMKQFVDECRPGSPFSDWFTEINQE